MFFTILLAENFRRPSAPADPVPPRAQAQTPHPARLMPDGKQLSGGVLFTTDPAQARSFATVLLVGESLAECEVICEKRNWNWLS